MTRSETICRFNHEPLFSSGFGGGAEFFRLRNNKWEKYKLGWLRGGQI